MLPAPRARRQIRQLRLQTVSRDSVPRVAAMVEDALRTASLPEPGPDCVVVIRHLDFGRIDPRSASPAVALQLERAVRRTAAHLVRATDSASASATAVWFRDSTEVALTLAQRLAGGQGTTDWFWPLVIPGWNGAHPSSAAWRRLLDFVQTLPGSAPVAGSVFRAMLATQGLRTVLEVLAEPEARRWREQSGFAPANDEDNDDAAVQPALNAVLQRALGWPSLTMLSAGSDPLVRERVVWLLTCVALEQRPAWSADVALPSRVWRWLVAQRPGGPGTDPLPRRPLMSPGFFHGATGNTTPDPPPMIGAVPASPRHIRQEGQAPEQERAATGWPQEDSVSAEGDWLPTDAGGLLFLIPVLRRLGFERWLSADPDRALQDAGPRLLSRLAVGARVPARDPIGRLWPSNGDTFDVSLVDDWRRRVRQVCRREARIGLFNIIRRSARMEISRTRVDLTFGLDEIDVRIRRSGLDLDPGWVPWLGRTVHFHYARGGEEGRGR